MVGQEGLFKLLDGLTIDTLPRAILLSGEYGSGKHTVAQYIANKFGLLLEDITTKLTLDTIQDIQLRTYLGLYVIDGGAISVKEENTILKFLEEPPKCAFIIILCETASSLLPTVYNRCYSLSMELYSPEQLKQFIHSENVEQILSIATTPGQVIELQQHSVNEMIVLADKIFTSISIANFANMLTITDKIAFKSEKDKFDYRIFFRVLFSRITNLIKNTPNVDSRMYKAYLLTSELFNKQYISHIDCKMLFECYLCELRECMK